MQIKPIKTSVLQPPQDNLLEIISGSVKKLREQSIIAITSKVVSIHQGRCVPRAQVADKDELIKKQADYYLPRHQVSTGSIMLTIKHNILIPSAGIDESNSGDYYILWPLDPDRMARSLWRWFRSTYRVKKVGVLIVDSHTIPMRRGVVGVGLSYYGFKPINDQRGTKDLFGRKLKVTTIDVVDGLAAAAVLTMGESNEQTPLALMSELPFVRFTTQPYRPRKKADALAIPRNEDLYGPLLNGVTWKKK